MNPRENPVAVVAYHNHVPRPDRLYELARNSRNPLIAVMIKALNRQIDGLVSGKDINEPLYRKPNSVRYNLKGITEYVDVNFAGTIYRGLRKTNGSMTFDQEESTVKIQHEEKYYLLYFKDSDVKEFGSKLD